MPADIRLCFIGDSFVLGTGDDEGLGWTGRLYASARRAHHPVTAYNLGVRRDTSRDIARRWLDECQRRLPAHTDNRVLFSFGVNDVTLEQGAPRVPETETLDNLHAMLEAARPRYRTLLIGPVALPETGPNAMLQSLSEKMAAVAAELDIPYLALFPHLVHDQSWRDELRDNDGAHPRATGYAKMAKLVGDWPAWWFKN